MATFPRVLFAVALTAGSVHFAIAAGDRGNAAEAKALLDRAVAHVDSVGAEKAYADFNRPDGGFVDRDLYVYCVDMQGNTLAHGANPALVGKNLLDLKDVNGVQPVREGIRIAQTTGQGTFEYSWPNPISKKIEPKSTYVSKVKNGECAVGYYRS
jgi:cytochrome c